MTLTELAARVSALEQAVDELRKRKLPEPSEQRHWWLDDAGKYANDPAYDEAMRLGKEYRDSLQPKPRKKATRKKVKKNADS